MTTLLKEFNHPYYAATGNFFSTDCHTDYDSWGEFEESEGSSDLDMNLVYRWDWKAPDPDDYTGEEDDVMPNHDTLEVFYIGQRKALARSVAVAVKDEDEPAVREWLTIRAEHLRKVWEPLLDPSTS